MNINLLHSIYQKFNCSLSSHLIRLKTTLTLARNHVILYKILCQTLNIQGRNQNRNESMNVMYCVIER